MRLQAISPRRQLQTACPNCRTILSIGSFIVAVVDDDGELIGLLPEQHKCCNRVLTTARLFNSTEEATIVATSVSISRQKVTHLLPPSSLEYLMAITDVDMSVLRARIKTARSAVYN